MPEFENRSNALINDLKGWCELLGGKTRENVHYGHPQFGVDYDVVCSTKQGDIAGLLIVSQNEAALELLNPKGPEKEPIVKTEVKNFTAQRFRAYHMSKQL